MKIEIHSAEQVGALIRASRKAMHIRQDDAAGLIGVSENFLGKVERGGQTVQWGKLFQVLQELGLNVSIEVPEPFADATVKRLADTQNKTRADQNKASAANGDTPVHEAD